MTTKKFEFAGAWSAEPDGPIFWIDDTTGFECAAARGGGLTWCGYVRYTHPRGEPIGYDDLEVEVHGGLTYGGERFQERGGYWYGFDTAHHDDFDPRHYRRFNSYMSYRSARRKSETKKYRTLEYVQQEVKNLAAQLKELKS